MTKTRNKAKKLMFRLRGRIRRRARFKPLIGD